MGPLAGLSQRPAAANPWSVNPYRAAIVLAGAVFSVGLAALGTRFGGPPLIADLQARADAARDAVGGQGISIDFNDAFHWQTRHPVLSGGQQLPPEVRARAAIAIAEVDGIGGVSWKNPGVLTEGGETGGTVLHCQDDVDAILKARSIRFSEASARIDPASERLLDEVAAALRPCVGSIIAINGHTDGNGNEPANVALSMARAEAVRWALIGRGIPADGLRAAGLGSKAPIPGLDPRDPANRRIDFSVIATAPVKPTPIDTPGAG